MNVTLGGSHNLQDLFPLIPGAKVESRGAAGLVAAIGCGAAAATGAAGEAAIAGAAGGAENAEEVAWPSGMNSFNFGSVLAPPIKETVSRV